MTDPWADLRAYVHHPDCDERCWVVRALAQPPAPADGLDVERLALLDVAEAARHVCGTGWPVAGLPELRAALAKLEEAE